MGPCREAKKPEVKRNTPPPPIKKKPRAKENDRPYVDTGDNLYDWSRTKPLINNVNDAIERGFNDVGNGLMVRGAVAARDIEAGEGKVFCGERRRQAEKRFDLFTLSAERSSSRR